MRKILIASIIVTALGWAGISFWREIGNGTFDDRRDAEVGTPAEGIATDDALWIRNHTGQAMRIDRATGARLLLAEGVVDILADGKHLWALAKRPDGAWHVADLRNAKEPTRSVTQDVVPIALFSTSTGPAMLASNTVILPATDGWSVLPLSEPITEGAVAFSPSDKVLYVGYDYGEFGGGLRHIDLTNGQVTLIDDSQPDELCTGLMNTACDPVVGIVASPQHPDCVLAGTSLHHLGMMDGAVVKACKQSLTPVFSHKLWSPLATLGRLLAGENQTWTFNSLVATHDGWVATGRTSYARASFAQGVASPKVKMSFYPRLETVGGLKASKDIDGIVFVEAVCCIQYGPFTERVMVALPVIQ